MTKTTISDDKVHERILLLRRFLPHLEWGHPNEVREKVYNVLCKSREVTENTELSLICANLRLNKPLRIDGLARIVSDSQMMNTSEEGKVLRLLSKSVDSFMSGFMIRYIDYNVLVDDVISYCLNMLER